MGNLTRRWWCGLFLSLAIAACQGQSGSDAGLSAGNGTVALTGQIRSSMNAPDLSSQTTGETSCSEEGFSCSLSFSDHQGALLLTQSIVVTLPTCGDLPVNGTTFSLGDYVLDPSRVSQGFSVSCECLSPVGGFLGELFGAFSGEGDLALGPDGRIDFVITISNFFDLATSAEALALLQEVSCFVLTGVDFLLETSCEDATGEGTKPPADEVKKLKDSDPQVTPGFFCAAVRSLVTTALEEGFCADPEPRCGNAKIEEGELCDPGREPNGCPDPRSVCPNSCDQCSEVPPTCGNAIVEDNEPCDQSAFPNNGCTEDNFCRTDCSGCIICGNNRVEPDKGEECDDGNSLNGDGCDEHCKNEPVPACDPGSGYICSGLTICAKPCNGTINCEDGLDELNCGSCDPGSIPCPGSIEPTCGVLCDGHQDCTDGLDEKPCGGVGNFCGNSRCEPELGENIQTCPRECFCGDGLCGEGEDSVRCLLDCRGNSCGNGTLEVPEQCEDGEPSNQCDGCNFYCKAVGCGDGACDASCGEDAVGCPADCANLCGNHRIDGVGEFCDGFGNGGCDPTGNDNVERCSRNTSCQECEPINLVNPCDGDGLCELGEHAGNCAADCRCGDGYCSLFEETPVNCPADCKCGNGTLDTGEQCDPKVDRAHWAYNCFRQVSCPLNCSCQDRGVNCGNGICESYEENIESASFCPLDCF